MSSLGDAIERQQAVQRKRTIVWALFGILVPVSLLFWLEVFFGLGHLSEIGILQLLAEAVIALIAALAAAYMYRSGKRYNKLLADPSQFLNDRAEID